MSTKKTYNQGDRIEVEFVKVDPMGNRRKYRKQGVFIRYHHSRVYKDNVIAIVKLGGNRGESKIFTSQIVRRVNENKND